VGALKNFSAVIDENDEDERQRREEREEGNGQKE
jgi:hypothetical protein